jgi:hypothetical protein
LRHTVKRKNDIFLKNFFRHRKNDRWRKESQFIEKTTDLAPTQENEGGGWSQLHDDWKKFRAFADVGGDGQNQSPPDAPHFMVVVFWRGLVWPTRQAPADKQNSINAIALPVREQGQIEKLRLCF